MSTSNTELTYADYLKEFQFMSSRKFLPQTQRDSKKVITKGFDALGQLSLLEKQTFVKLIPPVISLDLPSMHLDQQKTLSRIKSRLAILLTETVETGAISPSQQKTIDELQTSAKDLQIAFDKVENILQTQTSNVASKLIDLKQLEQDLKKKIAMIQDKTVTQMSVPDLHSLIKLNGELLAVTRQFDELTQAQFTEQDAFLVLENARKLEMKSSDMPRIKVRIP